MYARRSTVLILTWSSAYQLAQLWAYDVPLLGDKSSVPRSLKLLSCVVTTTPSAAMASPTVVFQLQESGVELQLEG